MRRLVVLATIAVDRVVTFNPRTVRRVALTIFCCILCLEIASASPACVSGQYTLNALANTTCNVNGLDLTLGALKAAGLGWPPAGLDASVYQLQVTVNGGSITFVAPGYSFSTPLGTNLTLGFDFPLTTSSTAQSGAFAVRTSAALVGATIAEQMCGSAGINGLGMTQYSEFWGNSCTVLYKSNVVSYTNNPGWVPWELAVGVYTNGGNASFTSSSLTIDVTPVPEPTTIALMGAAVPLVYRKLRQRTRRSRA